MKRQGVQRFLALTAGLAATGFATTQSAASAAADHKHHSHYLELPQTTACIESTLATGRANNMLSGIAVVALRDGRVVYRRGFGTIAPTSPQPVLPTTRFRIGSVTKSMTAAAVLSLVDEGEIRLHAPVSRLLPGFTLPGEPGWSGKLTAHRLLSHQGGLTDFATLNGPVDDGALAAAHYDPQYTSSIALMVKPGSFYNYSNPNFSLAGLLAEAATGVPYRELVRRRVFRPLGMTRATFLNSEVLADNDAAHGMRGGNLVFAPGAYDNAISRPAGYAWASIDDMGRFADFLLRGNPRVLSWMSWRAMQTAQVNTFERLDLNSYGYGLGIIESPAFPDANNLLRAYENVKLVWHGGEIPGYRALIATLPRQGFGYAVLINGDGINAGTDPVRCFQVAAVEAVGNRMGAPSPLPDPDIQRDRFPDYVGEYEDRTGVAGRAIVTLAPDGNLRIQFPRYDADGEPAYNPNLIPTTRDNFIVIVGGTAYRLTGIREGGSSVAHLRARITVLSRVDQE